MQTETTKIPGLLIITPDVYADARGVFKETFRESEYRPLLQLNQKEYFVQDNVSYSKKGVLRGLHYQAPPVGQGKLIQVLYGRVIDVAVDVRFGSPTFGEHVAVELTAANHRQFWVPAGFAHGFLSLEDDTVLTYRCTNYYDRAAERGLLWNDPSLGIEWGVENPIVSEKDQQQPNLKDIKQEFSYGN